LNFKNQFLSIFNVAILKRSELPRNEKLKDYNLTARYCYQLNMSQCDATGWQGDRFVVNIYNPLGKHISKYIRVPVSQEYYGIFYNFRVIGSDGIFLFIIIDHFYCIKTEC